MPEKESLSERQQKQLDKLTEEIKGLVAARQQARKEFGTDSKEAAKIQKEVAKVAYQMVDITHEQRTFAKKLKEASSEHLKNAGMVIGSELQGHFDDVLGDLKQDVITPAINIGKSLFGFGKGLFTRDVDEAEERRMATEAAVETAENMSDFTDEALTPGSIYTHDIHQEKSLEDIKDALGPTLASTLDINSIKSPLDLLATTVPDTKKMQDDMYLLRVGLVDQLTIFERSMQTLKIFWSKWFVDSDKAAEQSVNRLTDIRTILASAFELQGKIAFESDRRLKSIGKYIIPPIIGVYKFIKWMAKKTADHYTLSKEEKAERKKEFKLRMKQWIDDKKERLRSIGQKGKNIFEQFKKDFFIILGLLVGISISYIKDLRKAVKPFIKIFTKIREIFSTVEKTIINSNFIAMIKNSKGFQWLGKIFEFVGKWAGKGRTFITTLEKTNKFFALGMKWGKLIGRAFLPLQIAYETIKGLLKGETIIEKIKFASAGILSTITAIPEMIINGILWLFGSSTRVDFGADAIANLADTLSDLYERYIITPVFNFFGDIPYKFHEFITGLFNKFFGGGEDTMAVAEEQSKSILDSVKSLFQEYILDPMVNFFKTIFEGIKELFTNPLALFKSMMGGGEEEGEEKKGFWSKLFGGKEEGVEVPKTAVGGQIIQTGIVQAHAGEVIGPVKDLENVFFQDMSRKTAPEPKTDKELLKKLDELKNAFSTQKEVGISREMVSQYRTERRQQESVDRRLEPPDEIESLGILLMNKSWGMG